MPATAKQKPRLKTLDDLFLLGGGVNLLDVPESETPKASQMQRQSEIAVARLTPFMNHPFRLYDGERLDDMIESVRKNGVLVPIITRKAGDIYEILSGHNRVNAAKLAGMEKVPAVILENIPDDEAWIYVIETNLMQRSFADMAHSEKAAVISAQHSKLFSQGKRNDILEELIWLENPHENSESSTSVEFRRCSGTRERLAEEYSLKPNQVALYLRVHQLIDPIKARLDKGEFALSPAAALSFLDAMDQQAINKCIELNGFTVDIKKANLLRQQSEKGKLDDDSIYLILNGEMGKKPKPNRTPTVKVSKTVYARYFKPNQPAKEIQETVEKALDYYFSCRQE